jgi:hypothetical protein
MLKTDEKTEVEVAQQPQAKLTERALASLGAILGMVTLPAVYLVSREVGPAGRVVFMPFQMIDGFNPFLLAAYFNPAQRILEPAGFTVLTAVDCVCYGPRTLPASVTAKFSYNFSEKFALL